MTGRSVIDAGSHLTTVAGRTLRSPDGTAVSVVSVLEDVVIVRTTGADDGRPTHGAESVPLARIQQEIDRLFRSGETQPGPEPSGDGAEIVAALLLTLPGARAVSGSPRAVALDDPRVWDLRPGDVVERRTLHERFGGNDRARLSPSGVTPNVFVVVDPDAAETVLGDAGGVHVVGYRSTDGRLKGPNRTLVDHRADGRALRVFWRQGDELVYAGEFETDPVVPFHLTAVGNDGAAETRVVVRLRPVGDTVAPPRRAKSDADTGVGAARVPRAASAAGRSVATARAVLVAGVWPPLLLLSCAAVAVTTWSWTSAGVRPAVTTWFMLVCPGLALVRLLPARGTPMRVVLTVATSLTLEALLATVLLEAKAWSPDAILAILIAVTSVAASLDLRAAARAHPPAPLPARLEEAGR